MDISKRLDEFLKTSQHKSYFTIFVTLIFVIVIVLFGILPAYNAILFQSNENSKRDDLISKLNNKLVVSKSLTVEYNTNKGVIDYFDSIYPDVLDQANVIKTILSIVNTDSVILQGLTFTDLAVQGTISTTPGTETVNLSAKGGRDSIMRFIGDMEASSRVFDLRSVSVSEANDLVNYNLALTFNYFYYPKI